MLTSISPNLNEKGWGGSEKIWKSSDVRNAKTALRQRGLQGV